MAAQVITACLAVLSVRWDMGSSGECLGGMAQISLPLSMKAQLMPEVVPGTGQAGWQGSLDVGSHR